MAEFTPHEAPAHEAMSLPVPLPAKLTGRENTLAQVYRQLKDNKPVLLYGASGSGKTALAATLANAYTELAGGALYLPCTNDTLSELIVRIGRAYQQPDITGNENPLTALTATADLLSEEKPLIVLDGTLNPNAVTDFINRLGSGLPVLLVNDEDIPGSWTSLRLTGLYPEQAAEMFKQLADIRDPLLDDEVKALVAALNYAPFAIAVAAGAVRANKSTPAAFTASLPQLQNAPPTLLALTAAFRGLTNALQGLLLVLGATFTGAASAGLISLIGGAPEEAINNAMNMLVHRHLVERTYRYGEPYYRLHPVTYTFAQSWLRGTNRLDGLQQKARESILGYTRKSSTGDSGAHDRLAAEIDSIIATAQWAAEHGDRDTANQLAVALMQAGDFVSARGYVYELLLLRRLGASSTTAFPAYTEAEPATPAAASTSVTSTLSGFMADATIEDEDFDEDIEDDLDDEEDDEFDDDLVGELEEDDILPISALDEEDEEDAGSADEDDDDLEDVIGFVDEVEAEDDDEPAAPVETAPPDEEAVLRAALVQAKGSGDQRQQAEIYAQIAALQEAASKETEAIASYSEALRAYEEVTDTAGILTTLEALARLESRTDNSQAAVLHANRGIALAEQRGSDDVRTRLLLLLGDARQGLGESEEAIRVYEQALALARTQEQGENEAMALFKLGAAQLDDGDPSQAIRTWDQALTLFRAQNRRDFEARVLGSMGTANGELGRWDIATNFHESALYVAREAGDKLEEALQLNSLGYAAREANQLGQAVLRYRQALHLAYESDNRDNIVGNTVELAQMLVESPRHIALAELLVDSALTAAPNDRELRKIKERIEDEREALGDTVDQKPVTGTAREYAANAYAAL